MISHIMAAILIFEADAPRFDHGETEDNPAPVPNTRSISHSAAVTNAPAITAAQETPDECASCFTKVSTESGCWPAVKGPKRSIVFLSSSSSGGAAAWRAIGL